MADVVASGILNLLLDRLTDRMVEQFGRQTDVGAELEKLEGTLSTIRDVLEDAEARQVKEKALTGWLRRLKDVAYDIDDLLDDDLAKNRKRSAPESSTSSMKGKLLRSRVASPQTCRTYVATQRCSVRRPLPLFSLLLCFHHMRLSPFLSSQLSPPLPPARAPPPPAWHFLLFPPQPTGPLRPPSPLPSPTGPKREKRDEEERQSQLSLLALLLAAIRRSMVSSCRMDRATAAAAAAVAGADDAAVFRGLQQGMEIGWPTDVRHVAHVTFDRFNRFLGLPVEFELEIPCRVPSARSV